MVFKDTSSEDIDTDDLVSSDEEQEDHQPQEQQQQQQQLDQELILLDSSLVVNENTTIEVDENVAALLQSNVNINQLIQESVEQAVRITSIFCSFFT